MVILKKAKIGKEVISLMTLSIFITIAILFAQQSAPVPLPSDALVELNANARGWNEALEDYRNRPDLLFVFEAMNAVNDLIKQVPKGQAVAVTLIIDRRGQRPRVIQAVPHLEKKVRAYFEPFYGSRYAYLQADYLLGPGHLLINGERIEAPQLVIRAPEKSESLSAVLKAGKTYYFPVPDNPTYKINISVGSLTTDLPFIPFSPEEAKKIDLYIKKYEVRNTLLGPEPVGGVLLNKAASALFALSDINAVAYDAGSGRLLLLGPRSYASPPLSIDDLVVAIRAQYILKEDPGLSIGTKPSHRIGMARVVYYGGTENTNFGRVMFEADLLLKKLSLGVGPEARVASEIPGYVPNTWRIPSSEKPILTRMWFVPDSVLLEEGNDGLGFSFSKASVQVLTESRFLGIRQIDPNAESLARHITEHYDEYALRFPVLKELRSLLKIVAVVKWLYDNRIRLDKSPLMQHTPSIVPTPEFVPAEGVVVLSSDTSVISRVIGGVKFCQENPTSPLCKIFNKYKGKYPYSPLIKLALEKPLYADEVLKYIATYKGGSFAAEIPMPSRCNTLLLSLREATGTTSRGLPVTIIQLLIWILVSGYILRRSAGDPS